MTTQIELNEELVKEAFSLTDFQTEKELIEFALQELIRTRRKKRNLLDLSGKIEFADNYDYKALRENRMEKMSNPELLDKLGQLPRLEKFKIVQFLMAELAKEEGLVLDNEAVEIIGAVHTSNLAAEQLKVLELFGTIDYEEDYDYKQQRQVK
jgi:Arc/MetJ family transcription regulator